MKTGRVLIAGVALAALSLGGCSMLPGRSVTPKDDSKVALSDVPERVFWGDTHLHTSNSVDAFGFGNRLPPEAALRFASGQEVTSSTGLKAQLDRPLDFLVISDHSMGLGATKALYEAPRILIRDPTLLRWYDLFHSGTKGSLQATAEMLAAKASGKVPAAMNDPASAAKRTRSVWDDSAAMVERYNEPGKFTAFHGFEYTLMQGGNNLHRNVVFRDGWDKVKSVLPLDDTGHTTPEALWDYMEGYEKATGGHVLSIPHNGNLSNGLMWQLVEPGGGPMSASYARRRASHEPVAEITQIKGDSEAHPFLSPNDEFAGYGTGGWDQNNLLNTQPTKPGDYAGSYVREALKRGLAIEQRTGVNPYKYGVIGSTDAHTSLSTADENNFFGKHPGVEPSAHRSTDSFVQGMDKMRMQLAVARLGLCRGMGARQHAQRHLRCDDEKGSLRHHGPAHDGAVLRRVGLHGRRPQGRLGPRRLQARCADGWHAGGKTERETQLHRLGAQGPARAPISIACRSSRVGSTRPVPRTKRCSMSCGATWTSARQWAERCPRWAIRSTWRMRATPTASARPTCPRCGPIPNSIRSCAHSTTYACLRSRRRCGPPSMRSSTTSSCPPRSRSRGRNARIPRRSGMPLPVDPGVSV